LRAAGRTMPCPPATAGSAPIDSAAALNGEEEDR
jgi:hypothetical protein